MNINRERAKVWHSEGEEWSLADWGNALAGEVGELCNVIKKIRRLDTGVNSRTNEQDRSALVAMALQEVADVFLYLDLTLEQLSPDAIFYNVVRSKFNATSERFGFEHRMRDGGFLA